MIHQCKKCEKYFNKPILVTSFNPFYKNNEYVTKHCQLCMEEDFDSFHEIYRFEGRYYNQRSDLEIELEARGIEDIDNFIKNECERIEEIERD